MVLAEQLIQDLVELVRLRLLDIVAVILFDLGEISHKIDFVRLDPFGALDQFPADEEDGE
jgi:hypothetical protein